MFNIKLVSRTWDNPQRVPLGVIKWYSIKYVLKTKFKLKNMKFVVNFEKSVLGTQESPLRVYLQRQVLDLNKLYLTTH